MPNRGGHGEPPVQGFIVADGACSLHSLLFTLFTLHSLLFTFHSSLFTLYSSLFTLHSSLFTSSLPFLLYCKTAAGTRCRRAIGGCEIDLNERVRGLDHR